MPRQRYRNSPVLRSLLLVFTLVFLPACDTFEVSIEGSGMSDSIATPSTEIPRPAPSMMTPTPTPVPTELRVVFVKEGDVWLWTGGMEEAEPLTQTGDVGDDDLGISDDEATVAFTRRDGVWAINTDGTGERRLVSEADFDAMEPTDPGVWLDRFAWVPGTHTLAFNTHLRQQFGGNPTDDLHLVNADTLEHTALLPPGEGGHFYYSPDGSQVAIVRSGTIDLLDADGGNRRDMVLPYTPSKAYAEDRYYAQPVWAADGSALAVAIPPPDPYAQPAQVTSVWHIPADGTLHRLVAYISTVPAGPIAFSPDLAYVAYLQQTDDATKSDSANLVITKLDSTEAGGDGTVTYGTGVLPVLAGFLGWAADSQHFAFTPDLPRNPQQPAELPQAQIGQLGGDPIPIDIDAVLFVADVRWIDATRYLLLAKDVNQATWSILLGGIGSPSVVLASIPERPGDDVPPYDFAKAMVPAVGPGV